MVLDSLALRIPIPASSHRAHPDAAETSPVAAQHYPVSAEESPTSAVAISNVFSLNDLLTVAATWPEAWRDDFTEREAIMAIDASDPYVPAIREEFKDLVRVQKLRARSPIGEEVGCADSA